MKLCLRFLCLLMAFYYSLATAANNNTALTHIAPDITKNTPIELTPAEQAWLQIHPVVLVGGSPDWAPFYFVDNNGQYSGIANDYLNLIAKKTGLKFKVSIDQWSHQLENIRDKKIDMLSMAYYTEARTLYANYSTPYFEVLDYFFIRDDLDVKTLEDLNGKRVAIPKQYALVDSLKKHFPQIHIVTVDTFYDAIDAVLENRADILFDAYAVITYILKKESINTIIPFKSARKIGTNDVHMITRKGAPELTRILQKGLDAISNQEKQTIYNRWLRSKPKAKEQKINLTYKERQWLKDHPVVTIGSESNWPPYEFIDQSGNLQGLSADLIRLVADKLGIHFKIISQYNWAVTLEKARNHEIDMVSSIVKTSEREYFFNFTESYVNPPSVIFTRKDNFDIRNINDLNNKVVAVENQYYTHKRLLNDYPKIKLLSFEDTTGALKALSYGRADAYVGNQGVAHWVAEQNALTNLKVVNDTNLNTPLSLAIRKDWPVFHRILKKTFASISESKISVIRRKWLGVDQNNKKFFLNAEEKQWLNQHKTISFTGDPNWLPYEAFDNQGNYIGIAAEHLKHIEQKLGINIEIIHSSSWREAIDKVKRGEVDILSETSDSDLASQLIFTQPYVTSPVVIIMRSDEDYVADINQIQQQKIAAIKGYGYIPTIIKNYPSLNLLNVDTIQEGLTSVSTGETDVLFATLAQASYHISEQGINNVRIVGKTEFNTKLAFGIKKELAPLVPLFNRAINSISLSEKQRIFNKWGKQRFATKIDYLLLIKTATAFLLIIIAIVYWNRRLHKEVAYRKEIEAQTQALIDTIPLQVIISSPDGSILSANPQALRDYHIEEYEMLDLNISNFYNSASDRRAVIKELVKNNRVDQKIIPFKKSDGQICSMMISIMPIKFNNEKSFLTIAVDMTERLQLENALHVAKETAESASHFKSQFLANMSHEIRTPMNAVIGMSHLALNTDLDDKQRDYIEKIKISGQNLLTVINDILDFSKIEAGKLEIESTDFLLDTLLDDLVSIVVFKAEEKNLEIIFKRDLNITNTLVGDPLRISQVLLNLVQNAIKFTDSGKITIAVRLHRQTRKKLQLEFSVSDTGIGIDKDQLNHLFDAFVQADNSTTRQYGGTGLGLSISQQLVSLMGGRLSAQSEPGKGSTFSFMLSFTSLNDTWQETVKVATSLKDLGVLLITDAQPAPHSLVEILLSFSFDVSTMNSAEQAYALLSKDKNEKRSFDLILIDIHMTENESINLARFIKEQTPVHKSPIILLMTTYHQKDIISQISDNNLDGFLIKPTTPSTLFDTIHEIFHKNGKKQAKTKPVSPCFKGKVLLVDDNSINQQVAQEMLENMGLQVVVANNGEEATQQVRETAYDLIFMDIQMPGISGFETTRRIRKQLSNTHCPIIAMTAHAMAGDKERCLDAGMNDYLSKPIDPESLYLSVKHWLNLTSKDNSHIKQTIPSAGDTINWHTGPTGINLQQGLSRIDSNETLYLKLLQDFSDKYTNTLQILHQYIASDNLEETRRLMHTLCGVAGTIGAESLQNEALNMVNILRKDTMPETSMWTDFNATFHNVMTNLETWLSGKSDPIANTINQGITQDLELNDTSLAHITLLLEEGKPEARKLLARIDQKKLNNEDAKLISLTLDHVQNFDFSNALSSLSKLNHK